MSYNPANYPIADSNILRGSLIMTFDNPYNDPNAYYTVTVNSQLRNQEYVDSNNLFTTYLYVGDVVTVTMYGGLISQYLDVTRIDFTTDAQEGNNGIYTVNVTNVSGSDTVTFTATTVNTSYNFEYHLDLGTFTPPTPTPTPSITATNSPTPSITPSNTVTPSVTPSYNSSPTPTPSITPTNTVTPSITATITPTPSITATHTPTPSITATISPTPSITPSVTTTPGLSPTPTPTVTPSQTLVYVTWNYDGFGASQPDGFLDVYLNDIFLVKLSDNIPFTGLYIAIGTVIKNILTVFDVSTTIYGGELKSYLNGNLDNFVYTQAGDPAYTSITGATYTVVNGNTYNFDGKVGIRTVPLTPTPTATPFQSPTPTRTLTQTPTPTRTITPTASISPTPSITPTITPTNTVTPSITPTLTPTPSSTPTPITIRFKYVGQNGSTVTKTVSNKKITWGGQTFTLSNNTWTTSYNSTSTVGTSTVYAGTMTGYRNICRDTTGSQTITEYDVNIYVNGVLYTSYVNTTNVSLSACPTQVYGNRGFSGCNFSPGDVVIFEWIDKMA